MTYQIRALSLVDHDELAQSLVDAGVSGDVDKARTTIRSWRTKRGAVSLEGEIVIRHMVADSAIEINPCDFWDASVDKDIPKVRRLS